MLPVVNGHPLWMWIGVIGDGSSEFISFRLQGGLRKIDERAGIRSGTVKEDEY